MNSPSDTIAAIATPPGEGGVGIVRISGSHSEQILRALFRPVQSVPALRSHHLYFGHVLDPASGALVDEVLATFMRAPRTYTREDQAEIQAHGGPLVLRTILDLTLAAGARAAGPGEFTLRAFLNGRLDLAQAEAVMDVVAAQTDAQLRQASDSLGGRLSEAIGVVRRQVLEILAYLTARADFPEDDVPAAPLAPPLESARASVAHLIASAEAGILLRRGVRTVLVGRPNVGKSSLLNALLRKNRAIVTPIPGTTRDTLEETVSLQGIPFVLVDTAGFNETPDEVERLGIERSLAALEGADLVLLVLDQSKPLTDGDRALLERTEGRKRIVIGNKSDLPPAAPELSPVSAPVLCTSTLTGDGLFELEACMAAQAFEGALTHSDHLLVTNPRHKDALIRAAAHLAAARESLTAGLAEDLLTIDLEAALYSLGEITGEAVREDLLDLIFSKFCIGK